MCVYILVVVAKSLHVDVYMSGCLNMYILNKKVSGPGTTPYSLGIPSLVLGL